jgi:hypothetical protein
VTPHPRTPRRATTGEAFLHHHVGILNDAIIGILGVAQHTLVLISSWVWWVLLAMSFSVDNGSTEWWKPSVLVALIVGELVAIVFAARRGYTPLLAAVWLGVALNLAIITA